MTLRGATGQETEGAASAYTALMLSPRAAALAVLVVSAAVLGLAPILVRLADAGPAAAAFWRLAFAVPLLLVLTARPRSLGGDGEGSGRPTKWMALAALFFVLDLSFWHYGIAFTSVANATVLTNLTPVVKVWWSTDGR